MATPKIGRRAWEEKTTKESSSVGAVQESRIDPELCAEGLLEYLPSDVQSLIREAAQQQVLPLWRMLLGYVMHCYDHGQLFLAYQLAVWETGQPLTGRRTCRSCSLEFSSRFPEAAHCCSPCYFGKLAEFGHEKSCTTVREPVPVE